MKRIALMFLALTALAACNTIEGMGKDVSNAGETVTDAAHKTKNKINQSSGH